MGGEPLSEQARRAALHKFLAVLLLVAGLFFIVPSQYEVHQATRARSWQPHPARISVSRVVKWDPGRANGTADAPRYRADIRGELIDLGREFEIERIAFGQISSRKTVERYVHRYRPGDAVQVYVAPDDPSRVVLVRDAEVTGMYLLEALGAALVAGAACLYSKGRRIAG